MESTVISFVIQIGRNFRLKILNLVYICVVSYGENKIKAPKLMALSFLNLIQTEIVIILLESF